jgi:hypothetical protein
MSDAQQAVFVWSDIRPKRDKSAQGMAQEDGFLKISYKKRQEKSMFF